MSVHKAQSAEPERYFPDQHQFQADVLEDAEPAPKIELGSSTPTEPEARAPPPPNIVESVIDAIMRYVTAVLRYLAELLQLVSVILKHPVAFFLALWLLIIFVNYMTLNSLCDIAFVSPLPICRLATANYADFPGLVGVQAAGIEQLFNDADQTGAYIYEVQRTKLYATRMRPIVLAMDISETSKEEFDRLLCEVIGEFRILADEVDQFDTKLKGSAERTRTVMTWAESEIQKAERETSDGLLQVLISNMSKTELALRKTFKLAMTVISKQLESLTLFANKPLKRVARIEEIIDTIIERVSYENLAIKSDKKELLGSFWTLIGRNQDTIESLNECLTELVNFIGHLEMLRQYLLSAETTLMRIRHAVEELHERTSAVEILGGSLPVSVQLQALRGGIARLELAKIHAKEQDDAFMDHVESYNARLPQLVVGRE